MRPESGDRIRRDRPAQACELSGACAGDGSEEKMISRCFVVIAVSLCLVVPACSGNRPSVASVLQTYGQRTRSDMEPVCKQHGIVWPPARIYLVALKTER